MLELRQIDGFPCHRAGSDGYVYRLIKKPSSPNYPMKRVDHQGPHGYRRVALKRGFVFATHIVIATAFHGPKPSPAHEVRHLNGDRTDNRPENIAWGTRTENVRDMVRHGTCCRGEKSGAAKLSEAEVDAIRVLRQQGATYAAIAERYGVSQSNIACIVRGKSWAHRMKRTDDGVEWERYAGGNEIPRGVNTRGSKNGGAVLTEAIVREMRALRKRGSTYQSIADRYGVTYGTVQFAVNRVTWKHVD